MGGARQARGRTGGRSERESGESWGAFLTQLCAVVGGVFTVFGLIDGVLFTAVKTVKAD